MRLSSYYESEESMMQKILRAGPLSLIIFCIVLTQKLFVLFYFVMQWFQDVSVHILNISTWSYSMLKRLKSLTKNTCMRRLGLAKISCSLNGRSFVISYCLQSVSDFLNIHESDKTDLGNIFLFVFQRSCYKQIVCNFHFLCFKCHI